MGLPRDGDRNPLWSWPLVVDLAALGLDVSSVTMEGNGGHREDEEEGRAAHYDAVEDEVEGFLEDGPDDATDFPHTGAGEDDSSGNGDGDARLGAVLLPGDAREATGVALRS